jgi:hypothetical protein
MRTVGLVWGGRRLSSVNHRINQISPRSGPPIATHSGHLEKMSASPQRRPSALVRE